MVFVEGILSSGLLSLEIYRTSVSDEIFSKELFLFKCGEIAVVSIYYPLELVLFNSFDRFSCIKNGAFQDDSWFTHALSAFCLGLYGLSFYFSQTGPFFNPFPNGLGNNSLCQETFPIIYGVSWFRNNDTYIMEGSSIRIFNATPRYETIISLSKRS